MSILETIKALPNKGQLYTDGDSIMGVDKVCTTDDLKALAADFDILHDTVKRYANEDAWTGQFSKDGRQDLWLYGEGKATAVQALKEIE